MSPRLRAGEAQSEPIHQCHEVRIPRRRRRHATPLRSPPEGYSRITTTVVIMAVGDQHRARRQQGEERGQLLGADGRRGLRAGCPARRSGGAPGPAGRPAWRRPSPAGRVSPRPARSARRRAGDPRRSRPPGEGSGWCPGPGPAARPARAAAGAGRSAAARPPARSARRPTPRNHSASGVACRGRATTRRTSGAAGRSAGRRPPRTAHRRRVRRPRRDPGGSRRAW